MGFSLRNDKVHGTQLSSPNTWAAPSLIRKAVTPSHSLPSVSKRTRLLGAERTRINAGLTGVCPSGKQGPGGAATQRQGNA